MTQTNGLLTVFTAAMLFATTGRATAWRAETLEDPIDGTTDYVFTPLPESHLHGQSLGRTGVLGVQCRRGEPRVFLLSQIPFRGFEASIEHRIDRSEPAQGVWRRAPRERTGMVFYDGDDVQFIRRMLRGRTLVLRLNRMELGREVLEVGLLGFAAQSRRLRQACGLQSA